MSFVLKTEAESSQWARILSVLIIFIYFRHAAISERRVRSDQRKSENIMSTNRQSQLESDFLTDFKDGARADAVELITNRAARYGRMLSAYDGLKSCRLACLIFEVGVLLLPGNLSTRRS